MAITDSADIRRVAPLMRDFPAPWGVAGGWEIDLFLGRQSRPHADVDVAIFRQDQNTLRPHLSPARLEKVVAGCVSPWTPAEELTLPVHEVHATWPDGYRLEFLLNEQDRQTREWVFRRDPRIRRPLAGAFASEPPIPYLAPEIVLLYKSKAPTPKDDADLMAAMPCLGSEQRTWLGDAVALIGHEPRWADVILREA